ncbi:MAG: YihY/virulence factor BrkB family protein [Gemmatimonadota bacterium]|nr:YihY/virulence factor BrkB family protein [Gemmatimonadota bacterium]
MFSILKQTGKDFLDDDCPTMAASLAYYTVFSLPPLIVVILLIASAAFSPAQVQEALQGQFASVMGPRAGEAILAIFENAERPGFSRGIASLLAIGGLLLGATGAFGQLQSALNTAWEVKPDPDQGGLRNFILKRVFSFGMILGIALLLVVFLAVSAVISLIAEGSAVPEALLHLFDAIVSVAVFTLLFGAMFRLLPDAKVAWRDVWVGAGVTTILFVAGKFALGFYLGRSNPGDAFGAAGSLAVMLVWIYYASMVLLMGAEFTRVWADSRGVGIEPEEGAIRVIRQKRPLASEPRR